MTSGLRRFVFATAAPQAAVPGAVWPLPPETLQHLRVLRLTAGEILLVFKDKTWVAELRDTDAVLVRAIDAVVATADMILVQPLLKGSRLDDALRFATEVGVTEIQLVETERTVVRWSEKDSKLERWNRVLEEAARQAETTIPTLRAPLPLAMWRRAFTGTVLCTDAREGVEVGAVSWSPQSKCAVVVGPEGGLAPGDIAALAPMQLVRFPLGVLRAEHAGGVALALFKVGPQLWTAGGQTPKPAP